MAHDGRLTPERPDGPASGFFESPAATSLNDLVAALASVSVFAVLGVVAAGGSSEVATVAYWPALVLTPPFCVWALYVLKTLRSRGSVRESLWPRPVSPRRRPSALDRVWRVLGVYRDVTILSSGIAAVLGLSEGLSGHRTVVWVADFLTACAAEIAITEGRRRRRAGTLGLLGELPRARAPAWLSGSRPLLTSIAACGLVLAGAGVGFGFQRLVNELDLKPLRSDGSVTVTLPGGQDLIYVGSLGERAPRPFGPSDVRIVDVATGKTVPSRFDPSVDENSPDDIGSLGLISFVIPVSGRYRVTIHGPSGLRVWAGTSPGTNVRDLVPWFVTTGVGVALIALFVFGATERRRERRAALGVPARDEDGRGLVVTGWQPQEWHQGAFWVVAQRIAGASILCALVAGCASLLAAGLYPAALGVAVLFGADLFVWYLFARTEVIALRWSGDVLEWRGLLGNRGSVRAADIVAVTSSVVIGRTLIKLRSGRPLRADGWCYRGVADLSYGSRARDLVGP